MGGGKRRGRGEEEVEGGKRRGRGEEQGEGVWKSDKT